MILRKNKFDEKHKDDQRFAVITLKELAFAFAILMIRLAGATFVFFVEVSKGRSSLNMAKNRVWAMVRKIKFRWQKRRSLFARSNILCELSLQLGNIRILCCMLRMYDVQHANNFFCGSVKINKDKLDTIKNG